MGRSPKTRKKTAQRHVPGSRSKKHEPLPNWLRVVLVCISLGMISTSTYLAFRDNAVGGEEYTEISVTIQDPPKFAEHEIKSSVYQEVAFTTKEYRKAFVISGYSAKATDVAKLCQEVGKGDTVRLTIKRSQLPDLDKETFVNNYNEVFGIGKGGVAYVDFDKRKEIADGDSKYALFGALLGFAFLPFGVFKRMQTKGMGIVLGTVAVVGLAVVAFI